MIPCASPLAQYLADKDGIDAAVARVLASGWYVLGTETRTFEAEFAGFLEAGPESCVGVGSGTEALHLALRALGIGPGDEVITVSHTAVATVAAIELAGATPVLADIEPDYFTLHPGCIEPLVTPRTRAIIPVHLYGQPADMAQIMAIAERHGLAVLEDCAQAHGARHEGRRTGTIGQAGCFSFYPTKNLGGLGDGGLVFIREAAVASLVRLLREYGWAERYVSHIAGCNSRLDELQAAILRVKLPGLDAANAARQKLAARYDAALAGTPLVLPRRRPGCTHVFHLYAIRSTQRDALQAHLKEQGVAALIHYPVPVHLQPAYAVRLRVSGGGLPETEKAAREVLSLPLYPELREADQDQVIAAILAFFEGRA